MGINILPAVRPLDPPKKNSVLESLVGYSVEWVEAGMKIPVKEVC
jgi:hypothetical protein